MTDQANPTDQELYAWALTQNRGVPRSAVLGSAHSFWRRKYLAAHGPAEGRGANGA